MMRQQPSEVDSTSNKARDLAFPFIECSAATKVGKVNVRIIGKETFPIIAFWLNYFFRVSIPFTLPPRDGSDVDPALRVLGG
jgi:hypothetical protein